MEIPLIMSALSWHSNFIVVSVKFVMIPIGVLFFSAVNRGNNEEILLQVNCIIQRNNNLTIIINNENRKC